MCRSTKALQSGAGALQSSKKALQSALYIQEKISIRFFTYLIFFSTVFHLLEFFFYGFSLVFGVQMNSVWVNTILQIRNMNTIKIPSLSFFLVNRSGAIVQVKSPAYKVVKKSR